MFAVTSSSGLFILLMITLINISLTRRLPQHDYYEADQDVKALANSVVSLWYTTNITDNRDGTSTLQLRPDIPRPQRWPEERRGAFCSGFLIDDDIIVTA